MGRVLHPVPSTSRCGGRGASGPRGLRPGPWGPHQGGPTGAPARGPRSREAGAWTYRVRGAEAAGCAAGPPGRAQDTDSRAPGGALPGGRRRRPGGASRSPRAPRPVPARPGRAPAPDPPQSSPGPPRPPLPASPAERLGPHGVDSGPAERPYYYNCLPASRTDGQTDLPTFLREFAVGRLEARERHSGRPPPSAESQPKRPFQRLQTITQRRSQPQQTPSGIPHASSVRASVRRNQAAPTGWGSGSELEGQLCTGQVRSGPPEPVARATHASKGHSKVLGRWDRPRGTNRCTRALPANVTAAAHEPGRREWAWATSK